MGKTKKIKVTLVKSLNGRLEKQIATAHSLGLKRIGQFSEQPDNDQTRGKIRKIGFLIKVEQM
ncbi:MAG: 50S ribosomal protein L30 [Oscillospiraceae bacterium]|nr:50S ribosomal protein L30 [Oscillospiraceae bacterium]